MLAACSSAGYGTGGSSRETAAPPSTPVAAHHCAPPFPSPPITAETVFCADTSAMPEAPVTRIVDGDTIHVEIDGTDEKVRVYGIDTAETGQPCFREATDRMRQLAGERIRLQHDARKRDRYGRLLRYLYTPDGLSIDAELVTEGLAHAWREDGALRTQLIALEDRAREAHRGCLWATG